MRDTERRKTLRASSQAKQAEIGILRARVTSQSLIDLLDLAKRNLDVAQSLMGSSIDTSPKHPDADVEVEAAADELNLFRNVERIIEVASIQFGRAQYIVDHFGVNAEAF